jgi:hypothetical protein
MKKSVGAYFTRNIFCICTCVGVVPGRQRSKKMISKQTLLYVSSMCLDKKARYLTENTSCLRILPCICFRWLAVLKLKLHKGISK